MTVKMHTDSPLAVALHKLLHGLETRLQLKRQVTIFIAGGMAAHLYTQSPTGRAAALSLTMPCRRSRRS